MAAARGRHNPDERDLIRSGQGSHSLVIARRQGGAQSVELRHPTACANARIWPTSIAFAPAKTIVAVAYSDASVGDFNMKHAGAVMIPALRWPIPDRSSHQTPVAWFECDCSALHAVHGGQCLVVPYIAGTRRALLPDIQP